MDSWRLTFPCGDAALLEERQDTIVQSCTRIRPASLDCIPYEGCVRRSKEPSPGSDVQITLDLIRDISVDRKQAGLKELCFTDAQSRFLMVVVTDGKVQQFPTANSRGEQEDNRWSSYFRAKRRCRITFQVRSLAQQSPHLGWREDVRLEPWMVGGK